MGWEGGREGGKGEKFSLTIRPSHPREEIRSGDKTPDSSSSYPGRRYLAGLARSMKSVNDAQLPDEQDDWRHVTSTRLAPAAGSFESSNRQTNEHRFVERAEWFVKLSNNQWHGRSIGKCNLLSCNETHTTSVTGLRLLKKKKSLHLIDDFVNTCA